MKKGKFTLEDYIKIHHKGDSSQINFIHIDYSEIKTIKELLNWTFDTFKLPSDKRDYINKAEVKETLMLLFHTLGDRQQDYIVLERFKRRMTPELKRILEGNDAFAWKQALGFHLWRDYRTPVVFLDDPETKWKRPKLDSTKKNADPMLS